MIYQISAYRTDFSIGAAIKSIGLVVAMLVSLTILNSAYAQQPQFIAPHPVFLTIESGKSEKKFIVEIADEDSERQVGLMFREDLPPGQGMLFDFGVERLVTMWMRNTPLSLDMVFVNRAGKVVRVEEGTTPFSTDIVSSGEPVLYVLELNAGEAQAAGIRRGDIVRHPLISKNNLQSQ
ncbi:MAG: DUF192 domain-containing protein [Hyphomicrobiales bacterium]